MTEEIPITEPVEKPKKSFPWIPCLITIVIIASLAGLTAPMVIRCPKKADQTEASSNGRQIGLALLEFETEYGSFPDAETAKIVTANNPGHGFDLSGKSSNALFRQLFAANITQSEAMFFAKTKDSKKPDGNISPGKLLAPREVGFGCIAGLSTAGNPSRPIAFCPIIPGTTRFDPEPFKGFAVIVRADNSVASMKIDKDGHAISEGKNILSADHPIWKGKAPDIRYPE